MTVLAITGGVGGTKLAVGLAKVLQPHEVVFLVNTGDDFKHLGLHISPDLDTLTYTLANSVCPTKGWGRRDETWSFMTTLQELGGPAWFQLGDKDLALHGYRTHLLENGCSLSEVTNMITRAMGINHKVLPLSNDPIATLVETDIGELSFQHYFVKHQCRPRVLSIRYDGADSSTLNPNVDITSISMVVICPSNPYLSIGPAIAIPALRAFLRDCNVPVVAVSPIVQGRALKGPTTKIMTELGYNVDNRTIVQQYADFLTGFIVDQSDGHTCNAIKRAGIECIARNTVMHNLETRIQLARDTMAFGATLKS